MSAGMIVASLGWSVVVPAGTYFLGDPCYAVPAEKWTALLESCSIFECPVGKVDDVEVLAFGTAWGDGTYHDNHGAIYGVDAGLIGLTPLSLASLRPDFGRLSELGRFVTFGDAIRCSTDGAGRLSFGLYSINTAD